MSVENPSVLYVEQTLTAEQKERACLNVGAQPAVAGKGLSTNDYTDAEKLKLSGITEGAAPNVIEEITVNGTAATPVNKSVALTIPEAITVDQTYNGSSTNPQSGIAVAQALSGTGQVPTVTSNDDGKVLKASYDSGTQQGSFRWDSAPSGVPSTTSSDEGKVLGVTNSTGTLGWVSQTPAAHDSTVTVKTGDSTPVTLGSFTTDQASNSDITIPLAVPTGTGEKSGLMSAADKAKLDGLTTFSTSANGLVPKPTSQEVTDGKYLKSDGSWGVPTNTTYSTFDTATDGLVPKANGSGDTGKFLKGDGSWATPTDTTYSVFSTSADGLVPASDGTGETGKFLKGDGTWDTPTGTTYSTFDTTTDGLVPKASGAGDTGKFLKGDGSWATPTDTTYSTFDTATDGLVPKASGTGDTGKFLKGDGSWATPTDTTYSGGNGIDITGTTVSVDIATSGSGLEFSSNKLKVNGNASQAIEVGSSGVGIKLATGSGLEFSSGLKVKTDGSTIHTNASGALEVIGGGGGTTYTAGDGIDISAQDVISVKTDGTTIHANASGQLEVIGGGGGGEVNVIEGVKLAGAASVLTPDVDKNVTIPNAVATGETGATNGLMTADDKKSLGTAVQYKVNPLESGTPVLLAQQMYVVESDAQIISIAGQAGEIQGKGTIFFRVGV